MCNGGSGRVKVRAIGRGGSQGREQTVIPQLLRCGITVCVSFCGLGSSTGPMRVSRSGRRTTMNGLTVQRFSGRVLGGSSAIGGLRARPIGAFRR